MITKATADGTLYTCDWDMEPLFPLPNLDDANKEYLSLYPLLINHDELFFSKFDVYIVMLLYVYMYVLF